MNQLDTTGTPMPRPHIRERVAFGTRGVPVLAGAVALMLVGVALMLIGIIQLATGGGAAPMVVLVVVGTLVVVGGSLLSGGLIMVAPGEARVIQFLGRYVGTVRMDGLRWVNPFTFRRKISTRIRNHETAVNKVNDADGSPIEIAAVVVWRVTDTARAVFEVDDYIEFVNIQTEAAVRHIATTYPYDAHGDDQLSLRQNTTEITDQLSTEIGARVESAGVEVIESRITHLAYAQEIAGAMLRRQQAGAVVAARQRIVEGAVGMVQLALDQLAEQEVVDLDEERKAAMVSNLLVVLCADRDTQPVVNTGTLYT
ncbi:SPFH domain-containing protein [Actinophytocola gossypii]|uniref:SPFH domain-containing protein n=1 Tax=Actinophytocola gossypii TaxID=2812003 RepID=A0ABT2JFX2_9PSEU|nr:SPFH domain-containing protein [Actinophytocola gossypii]MCT2586772.1 SPFH domain-containing protein [Actinophytocola gossypii]